MESSTLQHCVAHRGILSVAVLGSRHAGKSTLLGHLLVKIGGMEPQGMAQRLARAEQDANDAGQRDAAYAWVVYKRKAERNLSSTLDLNVHCCSTKKHKITFTDTPGTREAVRFLARGVAGQDAALVVVDASCTDSLGERAVADTDQGLLYEHVLIAYGMGIRQLVVAINKMDAVNFSQERFEEVQAEVLKVLKKANYNEEQRRKVVFVPVAGLPGDNLNELSGRMPWFERMQGATLLEAIEAFRPLARPTQPLHQPEQLPQQLPQQQQQQQQHGKEAVANGGYAGLVMPVQCIIKVSGIGTVCLGQIEAGIARAGMQVGFLPCMSRHTGLILPCQIKSLESHCESFVCASSSSSSSSHDGVLGPGHSVGVALRGITQRQLRKGWVMVDADNPPKLVSLFRARILIKRDDLFNCWTRAAPAGTHGALSSGHACGSKGSHARRATKRAAQGCVPEEALSSKPVVQAPYYCPVLDMHAAHIQCRMVSVVHKLSGKTGKPIEEPEQQRNLLAKGDVAVVDFAPLWPVLVTPREECQVLGSFIIREKNYVVGIGGVTDVLEWWQAPPPVPPRQSSNKDGKRKGVGGKKDAHKYKQKKGETPDAAQASPNLGRRGVGESAAAQTAGFPADANAFAQTSSSVGVEPLVQQLHESSQTGRAMDKYCGFVEE
mmetsp:Transcript_17960/g.47018  ORF Transcript_17960/g.47018 Transcript_17960/m.47018 type:complete len:664 (+) Transcript_17960:63-2054(+)